MAGLSAQTAEAPLVIRRARPADIPGVAKLGINGLLSDPYEQLVIDEQKVKDAARLVVSGAGNYCVVADRDGEIVGAVSALVHDCMFYERKQASVIQFFTTEPGAGAPLIRVFLRWARSRPAIKLITFTLEVRADPRIGKLLRRMGLTEALPVYMEVR